MRRAAPRPRLHPAEPLDKDLLIAIALGRSTEIIVCPHARRGFRQGPGLR